MRSRMLVVRGLLGLAALVFALGSLMHTRAYFGTALPSLDGSPLAPFLAAELKVLWLSDSATLASVALICAYLAIRPAAVSVTALLLITLVPAGTTALLYTFLGAFFPGHLLAAACGMLCAAAFLRAGMNRRGAANESQIALRPS